MNLVPVFKDLILILLNSSKSNAWSGCPISCITKFVMSTILLIGFKPIDFNLFWILSEDFLTSISLIIIPE